MSTLSTTNGLSGVEPTSIHKASASGRIFVGYSDGSIDHFSDPQSIGTIGDIKRSTTFTSKDIRGFSSNDERLFVATGFGLQVFDIESLKPLYTISKIGPASTSKIPALSVTLSADRVWVAMGEKGLFSASINSQNLTDPSEWIQEAAQNGLPDEDILDVVTLGNNIFARIKDRVYIFEDGTWEVHPQLNKQLQYIDVQEGYLSAGRLDYFISFRENGENLREVYNVEGSNIEQALVTGDKAYIATLFDGIKEYTFASDSYTNITPGGPGNNLSFRIASGNGEIYIAPGGHDASGVPGPEGPGIFYYNHHSGTWKTLNKSNGTLPPDRANTRFARAMYDPSTGMAYLGSWGSGLAVLKEGEVIESYTCENSELNYILASSCNPVDASETRISGMGLDQRGNLWVSLSLAQRPLVVRLTDGTWLSYASSRFPGANFFGLIVDDFDSKWMLSRLSGLVVFNENGTPENEQDDAIVMLRSGAGQGDLQADGVQSLAKDQDGFIWVGTEKGITVFYDAFSLSRGQRVDGACPAFERRCLLREEQVNAIAVDGGNRKWVGTNNGVFLISPAGDEVILRHSLRKTVL
ncbi:MAG: two-component regulator propeller domain-containing protein [Bacteroidia bacterium]